MMVFKKNMVNTIQGYLPDLWSAVNNLKYYIGQNKFDIEYLNNVVDNLNITDIQRQMY